MDNKEMAGTNILLDAIQGKEEKGEPENFQLYEDYDRGIWDHWGTLGISLEKMGSLKDKSMLAITGKYENKYKNEIEISEEDRKLMEVSAVLSAIYNIGLAPSEVGTLSDYMEKIAKKKK